MPSAVRRTDALISFTTANMSRWARRILILSIIGWGLVLVVRCRMPRQVVAPSPDSTSAVYLVRHSWHAGIAVRRSDIPDGRWPVLQDFPEAAYLEVGWGDGRYYPARDPGIGTLLRAGLWPTKSVLHVVPVFASVRRTFRHNTIVRVPVGPDELDAILDFVAASFEVDSTGATTTSGSGYYVGSHFYRARLPYHVFNNCNHWASAALEAAGCDVRPRWTFTVGQVMRQAEACGTLVQR